MFFEGFNLHYFSFVGRWISISCRPHYIQTREVIVDSVGLMQFLLITHSKVLIEHIVL